MSDVFIIKKISFRSIFKILLVPTIVFAMISTFYIIHSDKYMAEFKSFSVELNANKTTQLNTDNDLSKKTLLLNLLVGCISLNFICSLWVWLCLKLYLFFFGIKIKGLLKPVAHDQMDVLADGLPPEPDKT